MPTYEYRCDGCGLLFEQFQKITDDPVNECPDCGAAVTRLVSGGSGIIFKGSGFYQTDYKNSNSCTHNDNGKRTGVKKNPDCEGCEKAREHNH